jgi:ABC-type multidrug transport system fused ATPase/permease subunit
MALDYETDKVIQESLRTELGKDVTVLTVAHRLQSIMDADRIVRALELLFPKLTGWKDGP